MYFDKISIRVCVWLRHLSSPGRITSCLRKSLVCGMRDNLYCLRNLYLVSVINSLIKINFTHQLKKKNWLYTNLLYDKKKKYFRNNVLNNWRYWPISYHNDLSLFIVIFRVWMSRLSSGTKLSKYFVFVLNT